MRADFAASLFSGYCCFFHVFVAPPMCMYSHSSPLACWLGGLYGYQPADVQPPADTAAPIQEMLALEHFPGWPRTAAPRETPADILLRPSDAAENDTEGHATVTDETRLARERGVALGLHLGDVPVPRGGQRVQRLEQHIREITDMIDAAGSLQGFVWTQLTDIQQEINGLLYFDRTPKLPLPTLRTIITSVGRNLGD